MRLAIGRILSACFTFITNRNDPTPFTDKGDLTLVTHASEITSLTDEARREVTGMAMRTGGSLRSLPMPPPVGVQSDETPFSSETEAQ